MHSHTWLPWINWRTEFYLNPSVKAKPFISCRFHPWQRWEPRFPLVFRRTTALFWGRWEDQSTCFLTLCYEISMCKCNLIPCTFTTFFPPSVHSPAPRWESKSELYIRKISKIKHCSVYLVNCLTVYSSGLFTKKELSPLRSSLFKCVKATLGWKWHHMAGMKTPKTRLQGGKWNHIPILH